MSGDICGCPNRRGEVLLAGVAATHPTIYRREPYDRDVSNTKCNGINTEKPCSRTILILPSNLTGMQAHPPSTVDSCSQQCAFYPHYGLLFSPYIASDL